MSLMFCAQMVGKPVMAPEPAATPHLSPNPERPRAGGGENGGPPAAVPGQIQE